jgi:hypothetical protein
MRSFLKLAALVMLTLEAGAMNTYNVAAGGSISGVNPVAGTAGTCTAASGWLSVPNAGACVHVASGTFSGVTTTTSGTSSALIVYISDTQYGAQIVSGNNVVWDNSGAFVVLAGFDISGNGTATTCVGPNMRGASNQVLGNYIHDIPGGSCPFGGAGIATQSPAPAGLQAIGNILNNIGPAGPSAFVHGIYPAGINSIVENNLISNTAGYGIQFNHNVATEVISNNVVMNGRFGGIGMAGTSTVPFDHSSIFNNIVLNTGNGSDCAIEERFGTSGVNNVYRNNLLAHNSCQFHFENGLETTTGNLCDVAGTGCSSPLLITAAQATNTNIFVNYTGNAKTGDYHLKAGSVAIAAGVSGACAPSGLTPCVPATDFAGTAFGSPIDIGAYSSSGGGGGVGIASLSPNPASFLATPIGSCSTPQPITLFNTGTANLTENGNSTITPNQIDFRFDFNPPGTCVNGTLAPGQTCTTNVKFSPLSVGAKTANFNAFTTAGNPSSVMNGTATVPLAPTGLTITVQ